ncbi:MAG: tetratricopeptide repeat protein [Holosporales bacterium]|nr:tetratricopeptide repeat protein [Holosporales bacterium]
MSEIFNELEQEVNEELRRDKLIRIWNQYGKHIIAVLLLIISCIIGYMSWKSYKETSAAESTQKLIKVLKHIEKGKILDAFAELRELSSHSSGEIKALTELIYAGLRLKAYEQSGKINEIQEQELDELVLIEKNNKNDVLWRDLAALTTVLYKFEIMTSSEIVKKLKPLAVAGRPLMFSALEVMGYAYMKSGDFKEAKETFEQISKENEAPQEMRQRVALMLQSPTLK